MSRRPGIGESSDRSAVGMLVVCKCLFVSRRSMSSFASHECPAVWTANGPSTATQHTQVGLTGRVKADLKKLSIQGTVGQLSCWCWPAQLCVASSAFSSSELSRLRRVLLACERFLILAKSTFSQATSCELANFLTNFIFINIESQRQLRHSSGRARGEILCVLISSFEVSKRKEESARRAN